MDRRKVLMVGWDAADWQIIHPLLDAGKMPSLQGLVEGGVMAELRSMEPMLSPMLWNTIVTGHVPERHGVFGFMEPRADGQGVQPVNVFSRKVKALWNILHGEGYRCHQVGHWATHPAEAIGGISLSDRFLHPQRVGKQVRHPAGTVSPEKHYERLAELAIRPEEMGAEEVLAFCPRAAEIDQSKDRRLALLATRIAEATTIQMGATWAMEAEPWDFCTVYFESIDRFCHDFMHYHGEERRGRVSEQDHALFRDLVNAAYIFHDLMLATLLRLAGPECTVVLCSDHGFLNDHRRPMRTDPRHAGIADWHRPTGILVMRGPGLKRDTWIQGAGLLDLTPTVLHLCGLPVGADMRGRVLHGAWEHPVEEARIPSWEEREPRRIIPDGAEAFPRPAPGRRDPLVQQFQDLGYIEPMAHRPPEEQVRHARQECAFFQARARMTHGDVDGARELLEALVREKPWDEAFLTWWVRSLLFSGYFEQARRALEKLYEDEVEMPPAANYLMGRILLNLGRREEAMQFLQMAEQGGARTAEVNLQIGFCSLRLKDWETAERAFDRALEKDPAMAAAWLGKATRALHLRVNEQAAEYAFEAVRHHFALPRAHFILGVALARIGWFDRARQAMETALTLQPGMTGCYRWLAALHRQPGGDPALAEVWRQKAVEASTQVERANLSRRERRGQTFPLPEIPDGGERLRLQQEEIRRNRPPQPRSSGKTFVVVSGLPRSGTSLMMQMLEAGGLPARTDGARAANPDNPRGFFEWEEIKHLGRRPEILEEEGLTGRALKVVSPLLPALPPQHHYKVLFLQREVEEIAASQEAMLARTGRSGGGLEPGALRQRLTLHRNRTLAALKQHPSFEVLEVAYADLVREPGGQVARVVEFLGAGRLPRAEAMAAAVDPALYRQRVGPGQATGTDETGGDGRDGGAAGAGAGSKPA